MTAGVVFYRAGPNTDFKFRFEWIPSDETWRIYILDQPSYQGRPTGMHETHRLGIPNSPYVCWAGKISDFEDARYIAAIWANATLRYISQGSFPAPPSQRSNPDDQSMLAGHAEHELRAALRQGGPQPPDNRSVRARTPSGPVSTHSSGPSQSGPIRRLLERIR